MPTISEARNKILNFLTDMGQSPTYVVITSFEVKGSEWIVEGEFKAGYLGDITTFLATIRATDMTLSKFKITGKKDNTKGYV